MFGNEDSDDGEKIFGQFLFLRPRILLIFLVVENQQFCVSLFKEPLYKFESKSCKPVLVGNHNLHDRALVDSVQKPFEGGAFEVEA
jgi:hypothetical protein